MQRVASSEAESFCLLPALEAIGSFIQSQCKETAELPIPFLLIYWEADEKEAT